MAVASSTRVDVVIPVHNAPDLVRRCVDSLFTHVPHRIGEVHVQDDASGSETVALLASLARQRLSCVRSEINRGFGPSVNAAFSRTETPFVLVLNSDTEASDDFVTPLLEAVGADDRLAAVSPAGNTFRHYDLSRYRERAGCVVSYDLRGYAFLARREAFEEASGFDPAYAPGYFEDTDLSRRWWQKGWWIGVCPRSRLHHRGHGSFEAVPDFRSKVAPSERRYYERWPGARRQVVLASGRSSVLHFPRDLRHALDDVLEGGGRVHWISPHRPRDLLGIEMRAHPRAPWPALRMLRRRARRAHRAPGEVWIAPGAGRITRRTLAHVARRDGLALRAF